MTDQTNTDTQVPVSKNNMGMLAGVVGVLILLGVGYFVVKQSKTATNTATSDKDLGAVMNTTSPAASTIEKENSSSPTAAMEAKTITVEGQSFSFTPKEIRVKQGEKVTIKFTNSGGIHDFTLDEFNVKTKQLQAGQSETVAFTPDKTGTFEYYCSVGNHRQQGMKGNLIVE